MGSWGNFSGLKTTCHTGLLRWDTGEIHLPMPSTCQGRRCWKRGFNPSVRKIPQRRKWKPTPVFFPGNLMDRGDGKWTTVHGVTKSLDMTEYAHTHTHTHTHKLIYLQARVPARNMPVSIVIARCITLWKIHSSLSKCKLGVISVLVILPGDGI